MLTKFLKKKKTNYLSNNASIVDLIAGAPSDSLVFEINNTGIITKICGELKVNPTWNYEHLIGMSYSEFIHIDDVERFEAMFNAVLNGNVQIAENFNLIYADVLEMALTLFPIISDKSSITGVCCVVKQAPSVKQASVISFNKIEQLSQNSKEIIGLMDNKGFILYESQTTNHLLGYEEEDIINKEFISFIHENNRKDFINLLKGVNGKPDTPFTMELMVKDKLGNWHDHEVTFINHKEREGQEFSGILYTSRDITEFKKQQSKILYLSTHDELTGLPNRKAFEDRVDLEIKLSTTFNKSFAVLSLTIEGFEFLNNVINHHLGDLFIIEVASRLKSTFSRNIEFIAKVGDNSFLILTKNLHDPLSISELTDKINSYLKQVIEFQSYRIFVTPKIGISIFPHTGKDTTELIMNAKSALYLADKTGSEHYRITSQTDLEAVNKLFSLRNDLKFALNRNQFQVFYQPIYSAKTKIIECVEALMRWEHPQYGLVTPNEFIYLAEQYELIDEIGEWIFSTAIRDLARWHKKGFFVRTSINVSPKQLKNPNFMQVITSILKETEVETKWVDIEITENYKLEDEEIYKQLKLLQEQGFSLSLDDFGTGYNSLKNLQVIKPDKIKLDRLFVKELQTNKGSESIITSVMQMANDLDITVIAEGIETEEQKNFLVDQKCDYLQGYLFSRPVTTVNMEKLLDRQWNKLNTVSRDGRESREYFRLNFSYPLEATMTISELNGKKIQVSRTKILVKNIGAGGLQFISDIKFPNEYNFTFQFEIELFNELHSIMGSIVHRSTNNDLQYYGVKFILTEIQREKYIGILNKMQVLLEKSAVLPHHAFVLESAKKYFQQQRKEIGTQSRDVVLA